MNKRIVTILMGVLCAATMSGQSSSDTPLIYPFIRNCDESKDKPFDSTSMLQVINESGNLQVV